MTRASRRSRAGAAFAIAACLAIGCAVERISVVDQVDAGTYDTGTYGAGSYDGGTYDAGVSGGEAATEGTEDAAGSMTESPSDAEAGATSDASCTNPMFVTSSPDGIWNNGGYFVFNNMWNKSVGFGPQTLYACSYHSWYVVSDQTDDAGVVKSYPNVQMNFNNVPVRSYHGVMSTFAETSPHVGVYEDAYDVWLNGVATAGSSEIMVWVDTYNRIPTGSQVTTVTLGGRTYDVWKTSDNSYVALVSTVTFTSGTVDLLEIFDWVIAQGWLSPDTTLGQIDFGVEIESTGGSNATYQFNDFSITTN